MHTYLPLCLVPHTEHEVYMLHGKYDNQKVSDYNYTIISTLLLSCKLLRMFLGAVDTYTCCANLFGFANVSGRIGTLFDFSAVQLLCEPFLDLRTFLGG